MAAGFPVKQNYAAGDILTAAQMNDLSSTLNYLDPTAKGDLFPASSGTALTRLAVGSDYAFLQADSAQSTGLVWNNAAWTSFTPVVTAGTGSITSYTSAGNYIRVGKLCVYRFYVNITSVGTAAGAMYLTMPFASIFGAMGVARDVTINGKMASATTGYLSTTRLDLNNYDNSTPFANGVLLIGTISYEVA